MKFLTEYLWFNRKNHREYVRGFAMSNGWRIVRSCGLCAGFVLTCLLQWTASVVADGTHKPRLSPVELGEQVKLANKLVQEGQLDKAVTVCTTILDQDIDGPYRARVLGKRADLYRMLHQYELSLADADAATRLVPENDEPHTLRHAAFYALGRYQEALSNATRAIELRPRQWNLYFLRGKTYMRFGYFIEAIDDFTSAIRLNPSAIEPYDYRALVALPAGRYELAEQDCVGAIKTDGTSGTKSGRYYTLGVAQFHMGKRNEAQASFERAAAAQVMREAERVAMIGSSYAKLFDYSTALTFYDRAVAVDPTNATILTDRGLVHSDAGDRDGAWKDLRKALELDSPRAPQYSLRGWLQFVEGQYEQSIQDCENVARLESESGAGYLGQGIGYLIIGQRSKAMEVFKTGLQRVSAEDDKAWLSIWYILAGGTLDEKTRVYLMQFSEQQWPNPLVRHYFGNLDEQAVLKLAKRRYPALTNQQECDANFFIGARLIRSDEARAREYLERAANTTPYHWGPTIFASKELERGFLTSRNEPIEKPNPSIDKVQ